VHRFLEARFEEPSFIRGKFAISTVFVSFPELRFARKRDCDSSAYRSLTDASVNGCRTVVRLLQTVRSTGNADANRAALCAPSIASFTGWRVRFRFRFSPDSGRIMDVAALRIRAKTRSLQRLGSCSASSVDIGGSVPSPPTTAGPRHARVSNIWPPAGRSSSCIYSDSSHHRGWHNCRRNLRLDPHIAPRLALLLPVS
jgi:hypothetical protein